MKTSILLTMLVLIAAPAALGQNTSPYAAETTKTTGMDLFRDGRIRYVIRCDDMGFCHSANSAIERILNEGTVSAVSVMVTTPWLDEAVEILKKHPEVSVGVHTTLNSEWVPYRWGPVLPAKEVPSLVDEWGKFWGTRKDMMARKPKPDEVENELRAQVDLALRKGLRISYLDHHMSAAVTTPELEARFVKVAKDYGLGISRWFGEIQGPVVYSVDPDRKLQTLVDGIRETTAPGTYLVVCHALVDTPEVRVLKDLNPSGPANMSQHRQAETNMLCSPELKQVLREKQIEVIGYDALKARFVDQMRRPE